MDAKIKQEIENCFYWGANPANCYGALAKMDAHLDEIDFDDDDDLEAVIDIALRSMRMDEKSVEFVEYLISKGFDINTKLVKKDCLILRAVRDRLDSSVIGKLVDLGADIYSETSDGDNVLLLVAGKSEELALYFTENFDLSRMDRADKFGITPLMYAVMGNYVQLTESLIAHGSDVNVAGTQPFGGCGYWMSMDGVTPLALAFRHGNTEIAKMLLEAGADETIRDAKGNPPVFSLLRYPFRFFANSRYNDPIFERKCEMLSLLKDLELTDAQGYTVLMRSLCDSEDSFDKARAYDNLPITLALLERGVNIEAVGNDGKRPLHLAVQALGDVEKKLVKAGADLNVQDREGNTPLLIACRYSSEKVVRYLVKAGADITMKNSKGETAMDIAAERGYSDAMELMMGQ